MKGTKRFIVACMHIKLLAVGWLCSMKQAWLCLEMFIDL